MAPSTGKNGRAHVFEIANRAALNELTPDVISDVYNQLNSKEPAFSKNTAFNKNFGTSIDTVCVGNDVRLSDARTPLSHIHLISDITNLQTELDNKANVFTGYTGSIDVIIGVDFTGQTITKKTINITNGIVVSIV